MVQSLKESYEKRKFGVLPEWAKLGGITRKNYDLRVEAFGKREGLGQPGKPWPFLSRDQNNPATADDGEWDMYFRDGLLGFPKSYQAYRDGLLRYFNVPTFAPQEFDSTWQPRGKFWE